MSVISSAPPTVSAAPATVVPSPTSTPRRGGKPAWVEVVAQYQTPSISTSIWQICNSYIPFIALWVLMYFSLRVSFLLTLLLAIPAGAFVMRIFIIQHDCGHMSFFKSRRLNDMVGFICGVITLTPYEYWRNSHARHHATSGDLDYRGFGGDVKTMTVKEYVDARPKDRLAYRLYRNPFIMFGIGPIYVFMISHRTPVAISDSKSKKSTRSLIYTDLCLLVLTIGLSLLIGFQNFLMVELPIFVFASTLGVWLFYVQHQFEDTYWRYHPEWDFTKAALEGSSYYKLPKILQWFTGNIGLHHIHHLSPRIPNYLLEKCHKDNAMFQNVPTITMRASWKILISTLALWDEEKQHLISFKDAHETYIKPTQTQAA